MRSLMLVALVAVSALVGASSAADGEKPLKLLFLGDKGHHRPADRFRQLAPVMKKRGIELTYTEALSDLNAKTLAGYDGLVVYANQEKITAEQEKALLDFVASGKGFVPLHCASFCFLNSPKYVDLVGAQFRSHGTGTFKTTLAKVDHPILKGYEPFSSWDETYVHRRHNEKDRVVLEYRVDGDQGAVDVGADARQGARLLHRLGPRRADVECSRISQSRRARHPLGVRARPGEGGRRGEGL